MLIVDNKLRFINFEYVCLFLVSIIILFLRSSYTLTHPYMYTEDGMWIGQILKNGFWDTLINAKSGYFVFGNIILLQISLLINFIFWGLNMANLPFCVSLVSYVFFALVAIMPFILLKEMLSVISRFVMYSLILLMPFGNSAYEILGRLSNVGYAFYFIAFCLLFWRQMNRNTSKMWKILLGDILILLCSLTNPSCLPLTMVAMIIEAYYEIFKEKEENQSVYDRLKFILKKFHVKSATILLILLSIVAILIMIRPKGELGESNILINWSNIIEFFSRNVLYPFVFPFYNVLSNKKVIIAFTILFILALISFKQMTKRKRCFFVALISATVGIIILTLINRPSLTTRFLNYTNTFPDRYYYVQSLMVTMCIVFIISELIASCYIGYKFIGISMLSLITFIYITNINLIFEFINARTPQPTITFEERVSEAFNTNVVNENNKFGYIVQTEFEGWNMWLPENNVISTIALQRNPNYINVYNNSDENWNLGVKRNNNILLFKSTKFSKYFLNNAKQLKVGNVVKNVSEINYVDNDWIWITLDNKENIQAFVYPNKIEVIK